MLELRNVNAAYGNIQVLHNIDITINSGEIITLIGANGAGKSTTLMAISGIVPVRSGKIMFEGEPIHKLPPEKLVAKGICQVPEGRHIFPELTVMENLDMGAFLRNDTNGIKDDLDYVFSLFPILADRRSQDGGTLSGGEQQMLAMSRALMARPKLLLLDEPSMGLAPFLVKEIMRIILRLNRDGVTILLVEQNARVALQLASHGYVLETGRIVIQGDAETLRQDESIVKAYLGE